METVKLYFGSDSYGVDYNQLFQIISSTKEMQFIMVMEKDGANGN